MTIGLGAPQSFAVVGCPPHAVELAATECLASASSFGEVLCPRKLRSAFR